MYKYNGTIPVTTSIKKNKKRTPEVKNNSYLQEAVTMFCDNAFSIAKRMSAKINKSHTAEESQSDQD
jgi:hypothetical protein